MGRKIYINIKNIEGIDVEKDLFKKEGNQSKEQKEVNVKKGNFLKKKKRYYINLFSDEKNSSETKPVEAAPKKKFFNDFLN